MAEETMRINSFKTALAALEARKATYTLFHNGHVVIRFTDAVGTDNSYWPNKRERDRILKTVKLVEEAESRKDYLRHGTFYSRTWHVA